MNELCNFNYNDNVSINEGQHYNAMTITYRVSNSDAVGNPLGQHVSIRDIQIFVADFDFP